MIPGIRQAYNAQFSEEKYRAFLDDLNRRYDKEVTFRVAETPVFVPKEFERMLQAAADDIIDFLARPDFKTLTEKAIPSTLRVPNETHRSLFLALDFGVVDVGGRAEPRLIEMQGFPSLFGWQDVLSGKYREYFAVPPSMSSHFGLDSAGYHNLLRRVLLGDHDPRETILLEIDPLKQNTAVDFLATQEMTGIAPVHIGDVVRKGRKLYYHRDGQLTEVKRIYNRVIFDELVKRTDLDLAFDLTQDVDVSWAGHPNWFFRISKYTMPMIKSRFIPECRFLSDYGEYPDDLENYVLKPLFSFSGSGVIFHVKPEDVKNIPDAQRSNFMLQRKVQYLPVLKAPEGMVKVEIRLLFLWEENQPRPRLVTNLARLSRGEMIGVKYNKDKTWVGGSVCFFEA